MSVKTHNYMTDDGVKQFVLHSDYAALEEKNQGLEKRCDRMSIAHAELNANAAELQARHNALRDAVAWERAAERVERKAKGSSRPSYGELAWASDNLTKARAEVDRLLNEGGE